MNLLKQTAKNVGPRMYVLKKDGHIRAERASYNDCLKILHELAPYSWHHAMKHEGWSIAIDTREGD
jgi:hypothetical protein